MVMVMMTIHICHFRSFEQYRYYSYEAMTKTVETPEMDCKLLQPQCVGSHLYHRQLCAVSVSKLDKQTWTLHHLRSFVLVLEPPRWFRRSWKTRNKLDKNNQVRSLRPWRTLSCDMGFAWRRWPTSPFSWDECWLKQCFLNLWPPLANHWTFDVFFCINLVSVVSFLGRCLPSLPLYGSHGSLSPQHLSGSGGSNWVGEVEPPPNMSKKWLYIYILWYYISSWCISILLALFPGWTVEPWGRKCRGLHRQFDRLRCWVPKRHPHSLKRAVVVFQKAWYFLVVQPEPFNFFPGLEDMSRCIYDTVWKQISSILGCSTFFECRQSESHHWWPRSISPMRRTTRKCCP